MPKDLVTTLTALPQMDVATDEATLTRASSDASLFTMRPQAVVYPRTAAAIGELVQAATESAGAFSLTARSGGTDMSGGPLTESVVVDMTRYFNRVLEVTDTLGTVQPGVFYRDFEAATVTHGRLMPAYPASREICTVGGMVATNAGGEKSLEYGKVERYIAALKVVLHDGKEYTIKPLSRSQLEQKMAQSDVEGELYRQVYQLLEENYEVVQAARPAVTKNSAGYNLWNVWDREQFDLTQLLVGSQGTLGIITEITFRLVPPKIHRQLLLISLPTLDQLAHVATTVRAYVPESFESYDSHTLELAIRFFPSLFKHMSFASLLRAVIAVAPQLIKLAVKPKPALVLLAEFSGDSAEDVTQRVMKARAALQPFVASTRVVHSPAEIALQWAIRRESFNLLRHKVRNMHTAPFIDDICVPAEKLTLFFPQLTKIMEKYHIVYTIAGHVGDGNFHIIPLLDFADPATLTVIERLGGEVFDLVLAYGGSISGEHNDGLIRSHYLPQMFGEVVVQLFKDVKTIFDPHGIFNPHKKIGVEWSEAKKFLKHS